MSEGIPALDHFCQVTTFRIMKCGRKPELKYIYTINQYEATKKKFNPLMRDFHEMLRQVGEDTRTQGQAQMDLNAQADRFLEQIHRQEYGSCRGSERQMGVRINHEITALNQPLRLTFNVTHSLEDGFSVGLGITAEQTVNFNEQEIETCPRKSIEAFIQNQGTETSIGVGVANSGDQIQAFFQGSLCKETSLGEIGAAVTLQGLDSPIKAIQNPLIALKHSVNRHFKFLKVQKQTALLLNKSVVAKSEIVSKQRQVYQIQANTPNHLAGSKQRQVYQIQANTPNHLAGGYKHNVDERQIMVLTAVFTLKALIFLCVKIFNKISKRNT